VTGRLGLNERTLTLLHTIEELKFRDELFRIFRQWDNYVPQQDRFKDEIARQGAQFVARMDNLDVAVVVSFLANGIAWFDGDNNLLPSSSGAKLTVDQLVPANNKNQLNGLIAASWATTSTDIVGQITAIKNQSVINTGYRLKYAFYGVNIPGYFAKNDSIKGLWQFNQASNANYQNTGRMPPEMLELMWIPAYPSFFEDQAGTTQNLFPADGVTFFPEIDRNTYTYYRGSYPVPTTLGPLPNAEAAAASFRDIFGRFRFAQIETRPPGIFDIMGTTFLPRFKVPNSVFIADVTP
jgi:hypothetical protein